MTEVREGCGVVIPPLCRCAAAALVAKCGAAAPRREEQFFHAIFFVRRCSLDCSSSSRYTAPALHSRSGARYGRAPSLHLLKTHLPSPPPRARGARRLKDPCAGGGGASTAAPHDGGRAPTRVRPGATGPDARLCPRRSGPLSLHLAHPCEMCARGRRPSDERRLIGRLMRRRVPKDLRSAGSGMI